VRPIGPKIDLNEMKKDVGVRRPLTGAVSLSVCMSRSFGAVRNIAPALPGSDGKILPGRVDQITP
jgi:hypothetical protein